MNQNENFKSEVQHYIVEFKNMLIYYANYFIKLYNIDTQNTIGQDIMQRILFLDTYKEQIKKIL